MFVQKRIGPLILASFSVRFGIQGYMLVHLYIHDETLLGYVDDAIFEVVASLQHHSQPMLMAE